MLNNITIAGRLTKEPECRITEKGITVCDFSVAVERDFKSAGEKVTDFFDCTAWRAPAEFVVKYVRKGAMVVVKGRMQCQNWVDKDGQKRRKWYIECDNVWAVEPKREAAAADGTAPSYQTAGTSGGQQNYQPDYTQQAFPVLIGDDEQLPF